MEDLEVNNNLRDVARPAGRRRNEPRAAMSVCFSGATPQPATREVALTRMTLRSTQVWMAYTVPTGPVPAVTPLLAIITARDWRTGLKSASRFANYCRRLIVAPGLGDSSQRAPAGRAAAPNRSGDRRGPGAARAAAAAERGVLPRTGSGARHWGSDRQRCRGKGRRYRRQGPVPIERTGTARRCPEGFAELPAAVGSRLRSASQSWR
jgi:hypothetical protein